MSPEEKSRQGLDEEPAMVTPPAEEAELSDSELDQAAGGIIAILIGVQDGTSNTRHGSTWS